MPQCTLCLSLAEGLVCAVLFGVRLLFFKAKLAQFANVLTREQLFQLGKATHGLSYRALNDILTRGCVMEVSFLQRHLLTAPHVLVGYVQSQAGLPSRGGPSSCHGNWTHSAVERPETRVV